MPVYDVECQITFERPVEEPGRQAFNTAAGTSHPGWHGPQTVVTWKGDQEAVVFLVLRGPPPEDTPPAETVSREAEERIRSWAEAAGLSGSSPNALNVTIEAIPRP
jgi:hypothetical protein